MSNTIIIALATKAFDGLLNYIEMNVTVKKKDFLESDTSIF